MEIKINIPKNDYKMPTKVRPEIVQGICEAFIERCMWSTFHPFYGGKGRNANRGITKKKSENKFYGFDTGFSHLDSEIVEGFNGAEMTEAFKALRKAGWHIFQVYDYGDWLGYKVSEKPFLQNGTEVTEFNDFID